jgi:hypothetical protein
MVSGFAGIIVIDRPGAIGGGSVDDTAFRQSLHHPVTHQQRNTDRNSERYHRTCHRFLWRWNAELCEAKTPCPGHYSLLNITIPFIEHSTGI